MLKSNIFWVKYYFNRFWGNFVKVYSLFFFVYFVYLCFYKIRLNIRRLLVIKKCSVEGRSSWDSGHFTITTAQESYSLTRGALKILTYGACKRMLTYCFASTLLSQTENYQIWRERTCAHCIQSIEYNNRFGFMLYAEVFKLSLCRIIMTCFY